MLKAVTRSARQVDDRVAAVNAQRAANNKQPVTIAGFFDHHATPSDLEVQVEEQDFELARKELTPSVSYEELKHYEKVRDQFEGGPKKEQAQPAIDQGQEMQTVVYLLSAEASVRCNVTAASVVVKSFVSHYGGYI